MVLGCAIELAPQDPGLGDNLALCRINRYLFHRREIDHEALLTDRRAGYAMTATANADVQAFCACKLNRGHDILGRRATRNQSWLSVDHAIPDKTSR
jgi:hypothetical protein